MFSTPLASYKSPIHWHQIFSDGMARFGRALWQHDPEKHDVQIGDMGYFVNGNFIFLFNATLPNSSDAGNTPLTYEEAEVVKKFPVHEAGILLTSPGVTVSGQKQQPDSSVYTFTSEEEKGAVLLPIDDASSQKLTDTKSKAWQADLSNRAQSWLQLAKTFEPSINLDSIVLITGHVKTSRWAAAAFQGAGRYQFTVWPDKGVRCTLYGPRDSEGISAYGPGLKAWAQTSVEAERDDSKAKDTARARDEAEAKDEAKPMIKAESDARARDMVTDNSKGNKKVVPQTTQTSSNVGAANSQASEGISAYGPGLKAWAQASVEAERDEPKAKDTARARDEAEVKDEAKPRIKAESDARARDVVTDNSKGNKKVLPQTTQTSSNVGATNSQGSEGISGAAQASVETERDDLKAKDTARARDETEVKDEAQPRIKAGSDAGARDMVTDNSKGNKKVVPQTTQTSSNVRTANPQVSEGISAYGPGLKAWAAQASVEAERHDSKAKNTTRARDETEVKDEAKPRIKAGSDTRARDMVTDTGKGDKKVVPRTTRTSSNVRAANSQASSIAASAPLQEEPTRKIKHLDPRDPHECLFVWSVSATSLSPSSPKPKSPSRAPFLDKFSRRASNDRSDIESGRQSKNAPEPGTQSSRTALFSSGSIGRANGTKAR